MKLTLAPEVIYLIARISIILGQAPGATSKDIICWYAQPGNGELYLNYKAKEILLVDPVLNELTEIQSMAIEGAASVAKFKLEYGYKDEDEKQ